MAKQGLVERLKLEEEGSILLAKGLSGYFVRRV